MWKTVLFLIFTLLVVPFIAFQFDDPLTALQQTILLRLVIVYLTAALACFLLSSVSKNYSQVDKLWSLIPILYAWIVADAAAYEGRVVLMAVLVTIWGLRLTYNFSRRGGYNWRFWEGEEDYRWAILQAKPEFQPAWKWTLFNLFFISLYQMGLILLFTLPILKSTGGGALTAIDYLLTAFFIGFVLMETLADQQQWNFQTEKHHRIKAGEPLSDGYEKGFVHTGLWRLIRHPNYAAEQALWIIFYCFSIVATGQWINWSLMGCLLLIILFKGSSDFSEGVSAAKYPDYAEYIKQVPRFLPGTKGWGSVKSQEKVSQ